MEQQYVTIWSKHPQGQWMIERTHTIDYARVIMGNVEIREVVTMFNGLRQYAMFPCDINPNTEVKPIL